MERPGEQIRVLVVEDSAVVRDLLVALLGESPAIKVVGTARDGRQAIEQARLLKPDIITMDVNMPGMGGIEATRQIMETCPTRVIVVTASLSNAAVRTSMEALSAGAVAVLRTPPAPGHPEFAALRKELLDTIAVMSEVLVVRRWARRPAPTPSPVAASNPSRSRRCEIVAIGGSTGAPAVLHKILAGLARPFPVPVLIVQHIAKGFDDGLADWLGKVSLFPVRLPVQGETLAADCAYIVPWGHEASVGADYTIRLERREVVSDHCPSVHHMFTSVLRTFGSNAMAVLLTGMGRDGAEALWHLHAAGATTLVQSLDTCAVPGMPGEALRLGAATASARPEEMADLISQYARGSARAPVKETTDGS